MARGFTAALPIDQITWGDINALDSLSKLSVSMWIYIEQSGTNVGAALQKFSDGDSEGWYLRARNSGSAPHGIQFGLDAGLGSEGHVDSVLNEDTWYHIVMLYDGTASGNSNRCKAWINGSAQTLSFTSTIPASLPASTRVLSMGKKTDDAGKFDGQLSQVACWAGVLLSSQDITDLAAGGAADVVHSSGLTFYAPMCGSDVTDTAGGATPTITVTFVASDPTGVCPAPDTRRRREPDVLAMGAGLTV